MSDRATAGPFPIGSLVFVFLLTLLVLVLGGGALLGTTQTTLDGASDAAAIEKAWGLLVSSAKEHELVVRRGATGDFESSDSLLRRARIDHDAALKALRRIVGDAPLTPMTASSERLWALEAARLGEMAWGGNVQVTPEEIEVRAQVHALRGELRTLVDSAIAQRREAAVTRGWLLAGAIGGASVLLIVAWSWSLMRTRDWLTVLHRVQVSGRRIHERHEVAVEAVGIGTWEVDFSGKPSLWWSDHAAALMGVDKGPRPATRDILKRVPKEEQELIIGAMREALDADEGRRVLVRFRVQDDEISTRWVECQAQSEKGGGDTGRRLVGVVRDVTELVTLDQARQRWMSTMEAQVQARTQEAERGAADAKALAVELSQAERSERQRLARVLHDGLQQLLVAARLRIALLAGAPELVPVRKELDSLLAESIQASRSLAVELDPPVSFEDGLAPPLVWLAGWMRRKHGLQVDVIATGGEAEVELDRGALCIDIVRELLFNVVKHAGVTEVRLEIEQHIDYVVVRVIDEGKGFEPSEFDESFGMSSMERRAAALGGRIWFDAAPGRGCRATVRVPLPPPTLREPTVMRDRQQAIRVLVVDDHELVRRGVTAILAAEAGIDVVGEAGSGEEAVERVGSLDPHVVVMDVSLPGIDGVEATRRIVLDHPHIRVVGLSAEAGPSLESRLRTAGASALVAKGDAHDALVRAVRAE